METNDIEEMYRNMREQRRKDKLEIKVYLNRPMASMFKAMAFKQGKSRSELVGEIVTDYLKAMANGMVN